MIEYRVEAPRRPKVKKFIEAMMPLMLRQLNMENSTAAVVIAIDNDIETDGVTVPIPGINSYMVAIKPRDIINIGLTLAHELVHVKQMSTGLLRSDRKGNHVWAGKKYSKKTPYLDQPWEVQAFSRQELILRRALAAF